MNPIIFDTETTGTDDQEDQIIEAAFIIMPNTVAELLAVKRDQHGFDTYCERFKPDVEIKLGAQAVHNIIASDLKDCTPSASFELHPEVSMLIGHNVDFDARFAKAMHLPRICTLAISRSLFPDMDSHTQSAMLYRLARMYNAEAVMREHLRNAHAALDDVTNCMVLLQFLIKVAKNEGFSISTWNDLHAFSEACRIPKTIGFGKHKGTPIGQVPRDYVKWYRGTADTDPYLLKAFELAGF